MRAKINICGKIEKPFFKIYDFLFFSA